MCYLNFVRDAVLNNILSTIYSEFTSRAKNQVECFKKRKNCDLKESLTDYIILQLKFCKAV